MLYGNVGSRDRLDFTVVGPSVNEASRIQALGADRSRLADELDGSLVKTRKLERVNRDIAEKLDAAIGTIRAVLAGGEGR